MYGCSRYYSNVRLALQLIIGFNPKRVFRISEMENKMNIEHRSEITERNISSDRRMEHRNASPVPSKDVRYETVEKSITVPGHSPEHSPAPHAAASVTDDSSWRDASLSVDSSVHESDTEEDAHDEKVEEGGDSQEDEGSVTISQASQTASDGRSESEAHHDDNHVRFDDVSLNEGATEDDETSKSGSETPRRFSEQLRQFSYFQATCFNDNIRPIDFVLCYHVHQAKNGRDIRTETMNAAYRSRFEAALKKQGFELEFEKPENSPDGKTGFVKIHAPLALLEREAELQNIQKPFIESDIADGRLSLWKRLSTKLCSEDPFSLQPEYQLPYKEYFTDSFERERKHEFLNSNDELTFFTNGQRVYLTWCAISNARVKMDEQPEATPLLVTIGKVGKSIFKKAIKKQKRVDGELAADTRETNGVTREHPEDSTGGHLSTVHREKRVDDASKDAEDDEEETTEVETENEEESRSYRSVDDGGDFDGQGKAATYHFLLQMGVYKAGFPLHDGVVEDTEETKRIPVSDWPVRKYLYEAWARPRQWRRYQPLQAIRNYYGEKVGLYFAWTGFYTKMLIAPSILGVLVTIYGLLSIPFDKKTHTICYNAEAGNSILCPDCPTEACAYTRIKTFCSTSKIGAVFDNHLTVVFSIFMAVWAVCFLEFWKRYQTKLCVDWDVTDDEFSSETVRPEYALRAPDMKLNPVTMKMEPYLKTSTKWKRLAASIVTVTFFILVVIGLLASVMIYKIVGVSWWKKWLKDTEQTDNQGERNEYSLIVSISSSVVNGIFIAIMSQIYSRIAWILTKAEFPRTDRDFENSYTYKVFTFQFVNFYGALFYLAIIRGRDSVAPHKQIFQTRCPISGCVVDVTIQLAIIFIGKQAINNVMELGVPLLRACITRFKRARQQKKGDDEAVKNWWPAWQRDAQLGDNQRILLFSDYLELLIQYGFVTMFVAAFPLAPLFAFLNNIIEIRIDAYKTLVLTQRCVPSRAKNLGPWYKLLEVVTRLAVVVNAVVIAFTTQFVDKFVYWYLDGKEWKAAHPITDPKAGFFYFTLSLFNTSQPRETHGVLDAIIGNKTSTPFANLVEANGTVVAKMVNQCYYLDYRYPPDDPEPYERAIVWWHVLAAKLIFVILFEHFVFFFQYLLSYLIPDVPKREKLRMAREKHLAKVNFLKREFGDKDLRSTRSMWEDDDEDDKPFVPDELPEWLTTGSPSASTATGGISQAKRQAEVLDNPEGESKVRRGKMITPNRPPAKKRPFMILLFRKLMLCD